MDNYMGIDLRKDWWFRKYWADQVTNDFMAWWIQYYDEPEDYSYDDDAEHEYWVRCAFALAGWRAAKGG